MEANACVPFGRYFSVGGQACNIDEILRLKDCLFVERGHTHGQRLDKIIEFGVRQSAVDVAIALGQIARNVVGAKQHFQGPASPDKARQSGHRSAARHQAGTNFKMRQDGVFATGEAHIACERELASNAGRAPADCGNRHDRNAAEARQRVRKRRQSRSARQQACCVFELREEIVMCQKKASTALSKTTTFAALSVSSAVTIAFSCGMVSGPKMFNGG